MEYSVIVPVEIKVKVSRRLGLKGQKVLGEIIKGKVECLLEASALVNLTLGPCQLVPFHSDQLDFGPVSVSHREA